MIMKSLAPILVLALIIGESLLCWGAPSDNAAKLHQSAILALKRGADHEAIVLLNRAIAADPGNCRYYNDRGVIFKRSGNLDRALLDYTRALEIRPNYVNALNNRGVIYLEKGSLDKAIRDFTEALKHDGLKGKLLTNRGIALARKGEHAAAVKDFEKAVAIQPLDQRAFLLMGESLEKIGKATMALKIYQIAVGLVKDPESVTRLEKKILELGRRVNPKKSFTVRRATQPARSASRVPGTKLNHETADLKRKRRAREVKATAARSAADSIVIPRDSARTSAPIESLDGLNILCRKRAVEGLSLVAADIYMQGRRFLLESDTRKALVRYEDTLQLAERNKNTRGFAWCVLEMGRIYFGIGDNVRAHKYFLRALRLFAKVRARDEIILTLIDLAAVSKALGHHKRASLMYSVAAKRASSKKYSNIVAVIEKLSNRKIVKAKEESPSGSKTKPPRVVEAAAKKERPVSQRVERLSIQKKGPKPKNKGISDLLTDLKKYRSNNNRVKMVVTLDRLAEEYIFQKQNDKALYCLTTSLAYREELGLVTDLAEVLKIMGSVYEKLGKHAAALEAYSRALVISEAAAAPGVAGELEKRSQTLARKVGLDPKAVLTPLKALWKSRSKTDAKGESQFLYRIGRLYGKAGMHAEALDYFERASASMLVETAEMYEKIGKADHAAKANNQAMTIFRKLDYSRYLKMMKNEKASRTLSRH
jgi:tetratricopeptide (TPR) repeat protein